MDQNEKIGLDYYDEDYFETGTMSGRSCYSYYRWMPEVTCRMAMAIIEYAEIKKQDRVLDFGCAKGFLVKALRLLFRDAYGCDGSEYAVAHAEPEVRAFVRQCTESGQVPFAEKFDICISKDVFEHIPVKDLKVVLRSIRQSSARLLCIVPLGDGEKYIISAYDDDLSHVVREGVDWWLDLIRDAGFNVVRWDYHVPGIKDSWHHVHQEGNIVILAE